MAISAVFVKKRKEGPFFLGYGISAGNEITHISRFLPALELKMMMIFQTSPVWWDIC